MSAPKLILQPFEGQHALSVNLLDYYQGPAYQYHVAPKQWSALPKRLEDNTYRLLALLNQHEARATFFVLGWTAKHFPRLIKAIHACGHECASLGYWHQPLSQLSPTQLTQELLVSRRIIEDITGEVVLGYRAPHLSLGPKQTWVWQTLEQSGYRYSSSLCPTSAAHWPQAPRFTFQACPNGLYEVPPTTVEKGGHRFYFSQTATLRLTPYLLTQYSCKQIAQQHKPILYTIYPSDIDAAQPRQMRLNPVDSAKTYLGLKNCFDKLDRLLGQYDWASMRHVYFQAMLNRQKLAATLGHVTL